MNKQPINNPRVWMEKGLIKCMSQMCTVGEVPCPRAQECQEVSVTMKPIAGAKVEKIVDMIFHVKPTEKRI